MKICKKISFDFDSTLSKPCIQRFAKNLIKQGFDVWIITSRCLTGYGILYDNSDLFLVAENIGIRRENIIFTHANYKYKFITDDFLIHIDDDIHELEKITNVKTVNVNDSFSIRKCINILNKEE